MVLTGEICFGLEVFLREENETGSSAQSRAKWVRGTSGRLGVAFSDSRPPRLVVDSSVCGLNDRCKLPERTTLPSAKDVIRCFPLRNNSADLSGFSLDIKSAHKRVVLKESEQGLLGFSLNDSLYFYRVCPFGATFSAYWWQRLGGWILRFFHHAVWIPHAGWLYVDDYLWLQRRDILPLVATFLALLCRILNIPVSWKKRNWTYPFIG